MSLQQSFVRIETSLPGVCVLQPRILEDRRGFFLESYHQAKLAELGITDHFVQDNHSRSRKHVLRGLHFQLQHPQAKLCGVVEGEVLDVAVDIRVGSPHFSTAVSVVLSAHAHNQIYIPPGFAHGFLALTDSVQIFYKCSDFYDAGDERGLLWSDPDISISWGLSHPVLSDKDASLPTLAAIPREFLPQYAPE